MSTLIMMNMAVLITILCTTPTTSSMNYIESFIETHQGIILHSHTNYTHDIELSTAMHININWAKPIHTTIQIKPTLHLITVRNINELNTILKSAYRTTFWTNCITIILSQNVIEDELIFNSVWKYYLTNAYYVCDNITTYNPFINESIFIEYVDEIVYKELPEYFEGFVLKVAAPYNPPFSATTDSKHEDSYELSVLIEASRVLKMELVLDGGGYANWGAKLSPGIYTNMYKMLYDGLSHVVLGGTTMDEALLKDFDVATVYSALSVYAFPPSAERISPWLTFFIIYENEVWIAIVSSYLLTVIVWYLMDDFNLINCFLYIWELMFTASYRKPKETELRLLFVFWVLFMYIIINCYLSFYISFLYNPPYEKQIASLEEAMKNGLQIGGFENTREVYTFSDDPVHDYVYENWNFCPLDTETCLNKVLKLKNFVYVHNYRSVLYSFKQKKIKLATLGNAAFSLGAVYVAKGYYALGRINEVISRLTSAGIIRYWDIYEKPLGKQAIDEQIYGGLDWMHMKSAFYLLLGGELISIIVFIGELIRKLK